MPESVRTKYTVRPIQKWECKEWLLKKHYAKRMPSISYAFGLYEGSLLIGVLTIGKPASPFICVGVCGKDYSEFVYEFNRLCVTDNLPRNTLSYFVGGSFRLLADDLIIVSYADTAYGHHGYIYQATNWIYTGLTSPRREKQISGNTTHSRHNNPYEQDGEIEWVDRSLKHRYVFFIGKRRKEFRSALKYPVQPYPKGDNRRYDASFQPITQDLLFV